MTAEALRQRIDRFRKMVEGMPDNHVARFGLANACFDAGLLEDAEAEYRHCLRLQPEWMAVAICLGRCLVMRGGTEEARRVLTAARELALRQGHSSPLEEIAELEERCDQGHR